MFWWQIKNPLKCPPPTCPSAHQHSPWLIMLPHDMHQNRFFMHKHEYMSKLSTVRLSAWIKQLFEFIVFKVWLQFSVLCGSPPFFTYRAVVMGSGGTSVFDHLYTGFRCDKHNLQFWREEGGQDEQGISQISFKTKSQALSFSQSSVYHQLCPFLALLFENTICS